MPFGLGWRPYLPMTPGKLLKAVTGRIWTEEPGWLPGVSVDLPEDVDLTGYHPVGTCRMGTDADPMAVLDPSLRTVGAEGLRVIDASMIPNTVSGNTNAAVLAVADKAADLILESRP